MSEPLLPSTKCQRCGAEIAAGGRFCSMCGAPRPGVVRAEAVDQPTVPQHRATPPGKRVGWQYSRGVVLLMLFALLGPLALSLLWRSPEFSRFWKIVLTLLVVAVTIFVVWVLWFMVADLLAAWNQGLPKF